MPSPLLWKRKLFGSAVRDKEIEITIVVVIAPGAAGVAAALHDLSQAILVNEPSPLFRWGQPPPPKPTATKDQIFYRCQTAPGRA